MKIMPFWFPAACLGLFGVLAGCVHADGQTGKFGDQGDDTYRNPIIAADYSDPDVIRVGSDYYMVASTFETSPGVTVLHSRDLVNWKTVGGAIRDLTQLGPDFNWDRMGRYGEGIFAPSLRYHAGKFWVFVNCHSGEGFFVATAVNPAGPWIVTQIQDKNGKPLRTRGWTDPCPFWDDDGKAYLASSRPGGEWFSYLFQMTPDGKQLLDADVDKMNQDGVVYAYPDGGTRISPFQSSEGNKIYKRNGLYYLLHIEFTDRGQGAGTYVFRSRNLYGTKTDGTSGTPGNPGTYDVFKFGPVGPNGQEIPGQGGLVDTPNGRWYWLAQFNRYGSDGRTPNLLPVTWIDDWPVPGVDISNKQGKFAWQLPKPIPSGRPELPQGSDEFPGPDLNPQWQWNHQPRAEKWSLTTRPGFLRLYAFPAQQTGKFFKIGNVINQRHLRSALTTATVKMDVSGMADGQEAGLAHFNGGRNHASCGIVQTDGVRTLRYDEDGALISGRSLPPETRTIWLRSAVGFDDICANSYSLDGKTFLPFGGTYKLQSGNYRGDFIGLYTFNQATTGYVDVDFFHYDCDNK